MMSKASSKRKKTKAKTKAKACTSCRGLENFERPRYFSGQLLTNHDLEAAQRYVIDKNRLHNRYLVGAGVVCGLAVRCHLTCDGVVVVEPGYAIDGCGNDITINTSVEFDVLQHIKACEQEEEANCYSKGPSTPSRCDGKTPKEYCLVLHYAEEPIKPVTALIRENGCQNNRCEPSRIRETFRFDLIEKEIDSKQKGFIDLIPENSFLHNAIECLDVYQALASRINNLGNLSSQGTFNTKAPDFSIENISGIFYDLKRDALGVYKKHPKIRCGLIDEIRIIESYFQSSDDVSVKTYSIFQMIALIVQLLIDCICDALLVPCPEVKEEGVLLACLTIRENKIEKICNIVRQQLVTGPSVKYWLEPLFSSLSYLTELICCDFKIAIPKSGLKSSWQDMSSYPMQFQADYATSGDFSGVVSGQSVSSMDDDNQEQFRRLFKQLADTLQRGEASFLMVADLSGATLKAGTDNLLPFLATNSLTALDVYNRPLDEVRRTLHDQGISILEEVPSNTTDSTARALDFTRMSWVIERGSEVELTYIPGTNLVTCIRTIYRT